jgi:PAS domain S-box-containing protein
VLAALVLFGVSVIAILEVRYEALRAVHVECRDNLTRLGLLASGAVDWRLHEAIRKAEDESTEGYGRAVAPLRGMLAASPSIKYLYTARRDETGALRFILDPTPNADENGDGENDHVAPGTLWAEPPAQALEALARGVPVVSDAPYSDKWGTFMSAFVPLRDGEGRTYGLLGADITADSYQSRVDRIAFAAILGLVPSALVSLVVGFATYHVRARQIASADALEESESRFRLMADAAPVMIWVSDESHRFTYFNRGGLEFRGKAPEEESAAGFGQGVHPDDFERYMQTFMSACESGKAFEMEYRLRRHDGEYRWVLERAVPRTDEHGRRLGLIGGCVDMHEDRLVREQLASARLRAESADRAKSEFLANMSHEIRSPLTAILGYAEVLDDSEIAGDAKRRRETIDTIRRNGEHLLQVVNDLLDLAKIEAGRMTVESIAASPSQVIRDVVSILHVKAWEKCIGINIELDTDLPEAITTDPTRLRQILLNLLSNAIKFTKQGSVTIAAMPLPDSFMKFTVTDTGIGMTPEQIERLFQPFTQADASTSRRFGGTGLGLCISRNLAQALGGDICVSSVPERGTVFTLIVKAVHADPSRCISASDAEAAAGSNLTGARVLLADDSLDNRRLLSFILTRQGAEVETAEDGADAVAKARAGSYDLVLMDTQMPGTNGYEATARLRAAGYDRPIIALTANAFATEREKCLASGCDDYASKPIDKQRLISLCALWRSRSSDRRNAA